jgi:hypothetical protein
MSQRKEIELRHFEVCIQILFTPKIVPMAVVIEVTDDVKAEGSGTLSRLLIDDTNSFLKKKYLFYTCPELL